MSVSRATPSAYVTVLAQRFQNKSTVTWFLNVTIYHCYHRLNLTFVNTETTNLPPAEIVAYLKIISGFFLGFPSSCFTSQIWNVHKICLMELQLQSVTIQAPVQTPAQPLGESWWPETRCQVNGGASRCCWLSFSCSTTRNKSERRFYSILWQSLTSLLYMFILNWREAAHFKITWSSLKVVSYFFWNDVMVS